MFRIEFVHELTHEHYTLSPATQTEPGITRLEEEEGEEEEEEEEEEAEEGGETNSEKSARKEPASAIVANGVGVPSIC